MSTLLIVTACVAVACAIAHFVAMSKLESQYKALRQNPFKDDDVERMEAFFRRQFVLVVWCGLSNVVLFLTACTHMLTVLTTSAEVAPAVRQWTSGVLLFSYCCMLLNESLMRRNLRAIAAELEHQTGDRK